MEAGNESEFIFGLSVYGGLILAGLLITLTLTVYAILLRKKAKEDTQTKNILHGKERKNGQSKGFSHGKF